MKEGNLKAALIDRTQVKILDDILCSLLIETLDLNSLYCTMKP